MSTNKFIEIAWNLAMITAFLVIVFGLAFEDGMVV